MDKYWVPHPEQVWLPCAIKKKTAADVEFEADDGTKVNLKTSAIAGLDVVLPEQLQGVDDICSLSVISEGSMLHTIKIRYMDKKIYTNVSRILIAMNPFQGLPIYNKETMDKYSNNGVDLPPHIYGIGQDAMNGIRKGERDQTILISGESGAGKTESAKLVLSYVGEALKGKSGGIEEKILRTNPILEAFGNAMTVRNNNSSRFGKWLDINFQSLKMTGCCLTSYLLEVTRVTFQGGKERGYHVFFQLLQARKSAKLGIADMNLDEPKKYRYVRDGQQTVPGIDDAKCFEEVKEAFQALGFSTDQQKEIWRILGGILVLGNCEFKDVNDEAQLVDKAYVKHAAELFKLSEDPLARLMTHKSITVGKDTMEKPIRHDQAPNLRDSISRLVYGRLFLWLLERINVTLVVDASAKVVEGMRQLGVLDIAGFETFEINSLEQLLINLSNEHLQQQFNNTVFKTELEDYKKEGISFANNLTFTDNSDVLELLDGKGSLLDMLDEAVSMPKCTDLTYAGNCLKAHEKQARMVKPKFSGKAVYGVKHFAGEVFYTCDGFIEKNADKPPDELISVLQTSQMGVLKELGVLMAKDQAAAATGAGQKKKVKTAASAFRASLRELMKKINAADPHYIRCVKPNMEKVPDKVTPTLIYQQLLFSGVFDAINIRKQGFSSRMPFKEFVARYMCIVPVPVRKTLSPNAQDADTKKKDVAVIMKDLALPEGTHAVGTTKVLLKQSALNKLEMTRELKLLDPVIHIQKCWRRKKARKATVAKRKIQAGLTAWLSTSSVFDDKAKANHRKGSQRLTVTSVSISALKKLGSLEAMEKALTTVTPILEEAEKIKFHNHTIFEATKNKQRIKLEVDVMREVKASETSTEIFKMDKALIRARELGLPEDALVLNVKGRIEKLQVQLPLINGMKGVIDSEGSDDDTVIAVWEALEGCGIKDKPGDWVAELDFKTVSAKYLAIWESKPELRNKKPEPAGAPGTRKTITGCGAAEQAKILHSLGEATEAFDQDALEEILPAAVNQGIVADIVTKAKETYEALFTIAFLTQKIQECVDIAEAPDAPKIVDKQLQNLAKIVRKLEGDTELYKKAARCAQKTGRKTLAGADGKALLGTIFTDLSTYELLKESVVQNKETMLSHTNECITEGLTNLECPAVDEAKAVQSFRNIMIGMYDKPASDIEVMSARQAVMEAACSEPNLRNEIYLQAMRQITKNPSERSMLMGWQLLRFLCQASPPRPDLMEFVEAFASHALASGLTGVPDERFLQAAGIDESEWAAYTVDVSREAADCLAALQRPQSWILASAPNASTVALQAKDPNYQGDEYDEYGQAYQDGPYGGRGSHFEVENPNAPQAANSGSCADKCCVVQ